MPVPKIENTKKKSTHSKKAQKRDLVEPEPLEEEQSLKKVMKEEGVWKSTELSALYTFIKQFGTSETALEFISACGVNRDAQEICDKVGEIRDLVNMKKKSMLQTMKKSFEPVGKGGAEDVLKKTPMEPINKAAKCHWTSATLSLPSQFRGFTHTWSKDAISDAFDNIPTVQHENVLVSESPMAREGRPEKLDVDYGKIRQFLCQIVNQPQPSNNLNALESSIVLQMLDELWDEAQQSTSWEEKAVLRGLFKNFQKRSLKENLQSYPDFPCDELSSTQLYLDPLRSRDWGIPKNARLFTRDDVDAFRINPEDAMFENEDEEAEANIDYVQIEQSEINSSRYPPASFIAFQRSSNPQEQEMSGNVRAVKRTVEESVEQEEEEEELLHQL